MSSSSHSRKQCKPSDKVHFSDLAITFTRKLDQGASRILSICDNCGQMFYGTVSDGLPERELAHTKVCAYLKSKKKRPA